MHMAHKTENTSGVSKTSSVEFYRIFGKFRVWCSLTVCLDTKPLWRQTPSQKKKAVIFTQMYSCCWIWACINQSVYTSGACTQPINTTLCVLSFHLATHLPHTQTRIHTGCPVGCVWHRLASVPSWTSENIALVPGAPLLLKMKAQSSWEECQTQCWFLSASVCATLSACWMSCYSRVVNMA